MRDEVIDILNCVEFGENNVLTKDEEIKKLADAVKIKRLLTLTDDEVARFKDEVCRRGDMDILRVMDHVKCITVESLKKKKQPYSDYQLMSADRNELFRLFFSIESGYFEHEHWFEHKVQKGFYIEGFSLFESAEQAFAVFYGVCLSDWLSNTEEVLEWLKTPHTDSIRVFPQVVLYDDENGEERIANVAGITLDVVGYEDPYLVDLSPSDIIRRVPEAKGVCEEGNYILIREELPVSERNGGFYIVAKTERRYGKYIYDPSALKSIRLVIDDFVFEDAESKKILRLSGDGSAFALYNQIHKIREKEDWIE